jgi:hypothetical protein
MTIFGPCAAKPPHHADTAATVVNPHKKRKGKKMGKAIRASALVLLLACSAQAGWMPNDMPAPPPPAQPASAVQEPTGGEVTTGETIPGEIPNATTDTLTQIALDLLAALPSLL